MSTPQPPSGPAPEQPGHRARAYAASLLSELTGQGGGLRFSSLGSVPSGPPRQAPEPPRQAPPDGEPRQAEPLSDAAGPAAAQDGEGPATAGPAAEAREQADAEPESVRQDADPEPVRQDAEPEPVRQDAKPEPDPEPVPLVAQQQEPAPQQPAPQPVQQPAAAATLLRERPRVAPAEGSQPGAQLAPAAASPAPASPAPANTAQVGRPAQQQGDRQHGSAAGKEVRPAPFQYVAVAQHHTGPARATANGALDQAGQRINSRVDRALVRRAALISLEAASLLDACDGLDERARAVDRTWNGEHHSATEVREFEGAWGAFYDAQGALAQHVA